ncbi:KH domain-containing, RNA-binding, signal transduction-associated protein 2 isoform X5 [Pteropus medius]|nr:KH domain-containing, RNA-binding, signal transduction-associated protein 2 isoform X5 [Pteropus giganteus]
MSILGKGSMRDKAKEEELRKSGEAKYAHLSDELHVLIEVFAPPGEAYSRMSHALEEIKKFLVPDYNDEIRQEQLRELSYLNGSEDSGRGRGIRGRGIRIAPTTPSRGRGGAIPPPPPPGRGVLTPRGTTVTRGALPVPPVARGVPTPRARGTPTVPGYRAPPPPAHEAYEEYGYDDGYGGEYDDQTYETYDNSYATQTQSVPEYYDYGHGVSEDAYDSYDFIENDMCGEVELRKKAAHTPGFQQPRLISLPDNPLGSQWPICAPEEWATTRSSLKAPPPRSARGVYREHPYGRY